MIEAPTTDELLQEAIALLKDAEGDCGRCAWCRNTQNREYRDEHIAYGICDEDCPLQAFLAKVETKSDAKPEWIDL